MKVALLNTMTPFVRGGAEILVDDLAMQLSAYGHTAKIFRLPFPNNYEIPLVNTIAAAHMLRFDDYDRVITFKFPGYCVNHPNNVIWMFHQFRQVYELWGTEYSFPITPSSKGIKEVVTRTDDEGIPRARWVYTNAKEVSDRLMRYNRIRSEVLWPPLKEHKRYRNEKTGDYIFFPSRLTHFKRQHLAIEAMRFTKSDVKLIIAGKSDEKSYIASLNDQIKEHDLGRKVTIFNEWISDERKIELMANSLAVIYVPYKEDSCGFVSMEGFYSSKPVICCTDSGGTEDLITDGETGFVATPDPKEIAKAMDALYLDKKMTQRMGNTAYQDIIRRDITWENTIRRLLK